MTGPYRLTRPTAQPSSTGIPGCYRTDADDDGAACALCYSPDMQQTLLREFPTCTSCRAGQWAAKIYYADRVRP
jgi:hypothetical protein